MRLEAGLAALLFASAALMACEPGSDDVRIAGGTGTADASAPTEAPTETATLTPTPTPVPCDQSTVRIVAVDKDREIVTLEGAGDLTGWHIRSERGGQVYYFPSGFTMNGERVEVISGRPRFGDTPTQLWWDEGNVWNNSELDPAVLVCQGNDIQRFES